MEVQIFQTGKACCGGTATSSTLILDKPVSAAMIAPILATGSFVEVKYMTEQNILYVESKTLVIQGSFNRNRLQVKCKFAIPAHTDTCKQQLDAVLEVLKGIQ